VRTVTAEVLISLGYKVLQADGGRRACELYREHADGIRVVLLDLTMPEMSGEQTLRELQAIRRNVKVIVLTGYTEDEAHLRFVRGELAGFLTKPFVCDELIATLEAATAR
jgi:CheY-like chemotaxis protein